MKKCLLLSFLFIVSLCYGEVHNLIRKAPVFNRDSYFAEIEILNIDNNVSTNTINFGIVSSSDGWVLSGQYVKLYFNFNGKIVIYTDNNSANTGYQKAGLISSDNNWRVPLIWLSTTSLQSTTTLQSILPQNNDLPAGWKWMKDKNDKDDPNTKNIDESWAAAYNSGYTFVSQTVEMPTTFYLYFCADFGSVPAGDYTTTIWVDFETDVIPPSIVHSPIEKIGIIGNKIVITANITDDNKIEYAKLYYKIDNSSWQAKDMKLEGYLSYNKKCSAVISASEISQECKLYYYIEASDGFNKAFWKGQEHPQEVTITTKTEFFNVLSGKLVVPDGNPEDGEVYLDIPQGALSEQVNITIIQRNPNDPDIPDGNGACASKRPVAVYEFKPSRLNFKKQVEMCLLYFDLDNDGKIDETEIEEKKLGIFWWDGFDWRYVGGRVDPDKNTVTSKIIHFSSLYAVFPVRPLSASDYRPKEKIITPSLRDGINDFATFDGLCDDYEIKIFDITGRLVKKFTPSVGNIWDGTDESGNVVESGVYIYQINTKINGEKKIVSGTITVAK